MRGEVEGVGWAGLGLDTRGVGHVVEHHHVVAAGCDPHDRRDRTVVDELDRIGDDETVVPRCGSRFDE